LEVAEIRFSCHNKKKDVLGGCYTSFAKFFDKNSFNARSTGEILAEEAPRNFFENLHDFISSNVAEFVFCYSCVLGRLR
jgi:hypothetical protein